MRKIRSICVEFASSLYTISDVPITNESIFKAIEPIEKSGEMAMVPWYLCTRWNGSTKEVNGKYVVEIEYEEML